MRLTPQTPHRMALRGLASALAATLLSSSVATATPYATCLTNNSGTVSFRLNENATKVTLSWNGGATNLSLGAKSRGLTVTNVGATSPFFVQVVGAGNNTVSTNNQVAFNSPRGVAVNFNPASPFFGRVYVGNTAAGTKGWGVYAHTADFTDVFGAAKVPTGVTFGGGGSAPWRLNVGEDDDLLYMADWTDSNGNLSWADQNFTAGGYALQPLGACQNGTTNAATDGGSPVGINNNHGSIAAVWVYGSAAKGNLTILTVDEDLQDDRTSPTANQMNSVWRYDVGNAAYPYAAFVGDASPLTNRIITPNIQFVSNVEGLSRGTNGYLYFSQGRSAGGQPGVYVVTNSAPGQTYQYAWNDANVWNSYTASLALGNSVDFLAGASSCTVSRDGRWLASMNLNNNNINIVRLTNGIPDLSRRFTFTHPSGTTTSARDLAFDAAGNLLFASSGLGNVYQITLGLSATNTTGSDGTFVSAQPPLVEVVATANLAERGRTPVVPGAFTFSRTGGDTTQPLTVNFTVSGTAVSGTDYTALGTSVTIPAGASSVNLPVTPITRTPAQAPMAVTVTLANGANYNFVTARSASVAIIDHSTPAISLVPVYTNMYKRLTTDFIRLNLTRAGETNSTIYVNLSYSGTAQQNADYTLPNSVSGGATTLQPGALSQSVEYNPLAYGMTPGNKSIIISVVADPSYTLGATTSGTFNFIESDPAPETKLWSDDFSAYAGTPANTTPAGWVTAFGTTVGSPVDCTYTFGYDYSLDGMPAAPNATTTYCLKATVNKNDTTAAAAALNFYTAGKNFTGNYALRFNMLLRVGTVNQTEHALFGLNHSGSKTNWNRSGGIGNGYATNQDGQWFSVGAVGGNSWDYAMWVNASGSATSASVVTNRSYSTVDQVFKNDNLQNANTTGNTPLATGPYTAFGCPGSAYNGALNWVEVEVAQSGNMAVLRMNKQLILATTNSTPFTNGNIMLGYNDMYDSIGDTNYANVYFANVRVVSISAPNITAQPSSVVVAAGGPANLSVGASTTTGTINYQWYRNGAAISNATSATYSLPSVGVTNYGNYWVVVDDGNYPVTSAMVTITPPAPAITQQPVGRAGVIGSPAAFTVGATTSTGVTNYQWRLYGTNLTGATSATYSIASATAKSFGPYAVTVSDGFSPILTSTTNSFTQALMPSASQSVAGSTLSLKFNTEVGPTYYVDYKTNLTDATWIPFSTNSGTGGQLSIPDNLNNAPTRFYRIRVQ